ncbi:MAG TPA: hypothetical protein VK031_04255 [Tissierellaceae bacterium]|nr:hypothetical protein [Tissierellaceae bacterium]
MDVNRKMIELWGDVVDIKHLIYSILISAISTMGAYFFAPANNNTKGLFYGLMGAVLGFIISTFIFKPKRIIKFQTDIINDKE